MSYAVKRGKLRSVFDDMPIVAVEKLDPPAPDGPPSVMKMQIETVFAGKRKTSAAIYIVLNGERVAFRGQQHGEPAWVPMSDKISNIVGDLSKPSGAPR